MMIILLGLVPSDSFAAVVISALTMNLLLWLLVNLAILVGILLWALLYGWTHFARSLPELKGWQLDAPKSEFQAADAQPDYGLDDYLAQEERVFQELGSLVSGPWSKEQTGSFSRFQENSICNPANILDRNWNRTFVLESANPIGGALLLHGLSDSPYSLRALGERLHREGYSVIGLRLPGHGTCPAALAQVVRQDWTAAVRVAAAGLRAKLPAGTPLILVGYSNGGALSLNYALDAVLDHSLPRPSAIVLFSPMIGVSAMAKLTRFHHVIAALSGEKRAHWSAVDTEVDPFKYGSWPMNASVQAWHMTRQVELRLAALHQARRIGELPPMLAFQSVVDSTVIVPRLMIELFDRLAPGQGKLVLFDVNRVGWLKNLLDLAFERKVKPALQQSGLTYQLTLVSNETEKSLQVIAKTRDGQSLQESPLNAAWPADVFSLSHIALPIPPDDPVYGTAEATVKTGLPLGSLTARGERGILGVSDGLLFRQRYNPFYQFTEDQTLQWLRANVNRVRD